jgi:outer membrane protein assembly factor BamB
MMTLSEAANAMLGRSKWLSLLLLLSLSVFSAYGQSSLQYVTPQEAWRAEFAPVGQRNGVFMSPDGEVLVGISMTAIVSAFDPLTGTQLWTFTPAPLSGATTTSASGITFNGVADPSYLVFSVTDDASGKITW